VKIGLCGPRKPQKKCQPQPQACICYLSDKPAQRRPTDPATAVSKYTFCVCCKEILTAQLRRLLGA